MAKESKCCSSDHPASGNRDQGNCCQGLPGGHDHDGHDGHHDHDGYDGHDGHDYDVFVTSVYRAPQKSQQR